MLMKYRYPCVRVKQTANASDLILFSASAVEMDKWVGIPQRLSLEDAETSGFQRTVSKAREQALRKFFAEPRNTIQNPLLCAIRSTPGTQVSFQSDDKFKDIGFIEIEYSDLSARPISELLKEVRLILEKRNEYLKSRARPDEILIGLQTTYGKNSSEDFIQDSGLDESDVDEDSLEVDDDDNVSDEPAEEALFDESQITDFWDQLKARELLCEKVPDLAGADNVAGFSKDMLVSYLRPVILVDGQHRLAGALLAARDQSDTSKEAEELVLGGMEASKAREQVMNEVAKRLPISLLMDESPAEHVFQYVVVNQKATPVSKALLGTIISTSLAADELDSIAARLEDARIPLEGSRVISILSRAPDSPFLGLVTKGMEDEGVHKLPWSVLGSLADMFRYLENGKLFHDPADHAKTWRNHQLEKSPIVEEWHSAGFDSAYDYWQDLNGPWIKVFKSFWTCTRDKLANTANESAKNYWGNPRDSNIFNKPSLHILAADFFCFLRETKNTIGSMSDIPSLVDDWLEYVSVQYFARDWKLAGVKKDSVGIRRQWSKVWTNHRRDGGNLPAITQYSQIYKG
jgi:hypothetical protein